MAKAITRTRTISDHLTESFSFLRDNDPAPCPFCEMHRAETDEANRRQKEAEQDATRAQRLNYELLKELEHERRRRQESEQTLQRAQSRGDAFDKERAQLKKDLAQAHAELGDARDEIEYLEEELSGADQRKDALGEELREARQAIAAAERLKKDFATAQRNLRTARQEIERLKEELSEAQQSENALNKAFREIRQREASVAERYKQELATAEGNLRSARQQVTKLEQELSEAKQRERTLTEELRQLRLKGGPRTSTIKPEAVFSALRKKYAQQFHSDPGYMRTKTEAERIRMTEREEALKIVNGILSTMEEDYKKKGNLG